MKKPDFFIVGAPKCGTTAMYEYLRQHPEIFMPEDAKEPFYFGSDMNCKALRLTLEEYFSLFSLAKGEKRLGEASVWYLYSKKAAAEIKEFCPSARIIIMLRNPVDMLYSLHSELFYCADENMENFKAALDAEESRKKEGYKPGGYLPVKCLFYREIVKYTEQVQRYFDAFGRENVHVIIFDDFKNDTLKAYKETLRFLEVDEIFQPEFKVINPNKQIKNETVHKFLFYSPLFIRKAVRLFLPEKIRWKMRMAVRNLNTRDESRKPMDPELRKILQAEFAPEVERLSELLGRDLTHWNKE